MSLILAVSLVVLVVIVVVGAAGYLIDQSAGNHELTASNPRSIFHSSRPVDGKKEHVR